jgi:hypothetical protein
MNVEWISNPSPSTSYVLDQNKQKWIVLKSFCLIKFNLQRKEGYEASY